MGAVVLHSWTGHLWWHSRDAPHVAETGRVGGAMRAHRPCPYALQTCIGHIICPLTCHPDTLPDADLRLAPARPDLALIHDDDGERARSHARWRGQCQAGYRPPGPCATQGEQHCTARPAPYAQRLRRTVRARSRARPRTTTRRAPHAGLPTRFFLTVCRIATAEASESWRLTPTRRRRGRQRLSGFSADDTGTRPPQRKCREA